MTYMSTAQAAAKATTAGSKPAAKQQWTPEAREAHRSAQEAPAAPTPTQPAKAPPSQPTRQDAPPASEPQHYTRIAKAGAILHLVTPAGIAADLSVNAGTPPEEIAALLKAVSMAASMATDAGWTAASSMSAADHDAPSAADIAQEPKLLGYICSRTFDAQTGLPSWIIADGHQAHLHSKQFDSWYSFKAGEDYVRVFTLKKGDAVPKIAWPAGMEPAQ